MPLFSCGINYQSAPIHIRERLAFNASQIKAELPHLCQLEAVNEAVLLSTCNRTEIYMAGAHAQGLQQWFQQRSRAANIPIELHYYQHQADDAVRHLLRVSSGLDSMVLGEPQIFGQIKQAYRLACEAGAAGPELQQLFPAVFAATKTIRQETQIGAHSLSMAYAVVQTAKRIFTHLQNCCVLLIGAGELIELMMTHLKDQHLRQIMVANRTWSKAQQLAQSIGGIGIRIGDIPAYLSQIDIVITATSSQLPIIGKGLVETTIKMKKRRPILMIDLAVPRDIEPEVGQLADIYLYNIDDLREIIEANLKNRRQAAQQAEQWVALQAAHYLRQRHITHVSDIITQFRRQAEQHRDNSVQKALSEFQQGRDPQDIIHQLAHQLTNKILHQPTQTLRQLAYQQQDEALLLAKKLLLAE